MRDDIIINGITDDMVAALMDGTATAEEIRMILAALPHCKELQEIITVAIGVDRDLALGFDVEDMLLKRAYAASSKRGNLCCWECEKHILDKHHIAYDEAEMLSVAEKNMWICDKGTALNNIGRSAESLGMSIEQRFMGSLEDLCQALESKRDVIVAVDGGELLGDRWMEMMEDIFDGEKPDHTVVVLGYDKELNTVTVYDPNSDTDTDSYPIEQFMDAWNDSNNYFVTVCK